MRYVINVEIWLYDFGGIDISYLSDIHFELLASGNKNQCIHGLRFDTLCIVKFYYMFISSVLVLYSLLIMISSI